jgi:hypothetical protein
MLSCLLTSLSERNPAGIPLLAENPPKGKPRTHDLIQHQLGAGLTVGALGVSLRASSPTHALTSGALWVRGKRGSCANSF